MSSNNAFTFEFDPSSLPQLASNGDNYLEWHTAWTIAFRYTELWDVVSNTRSNPTISADTSSSIPTADVSQWAEDDNKAMVMMMSAVHPNLVMLVTTSSSAHQAWTTLRNRFHRDTAHSTIHKFRQLLSMEYEESEDLMQHLNVFHQMWTDLEHHCTLSTHELAKNLNAVFSSESIKGSFFLATLPETMNTVVNNLSTRDINKFTDITFEMLDIANRRNQLANKKAYYAEYR